jgi:hypothetical protein
VDARSPTGPKRSRGREEHNVVLALVVSFLVIMIKESGQGASQRGFTE